MPRPALRRVVDPVVVVSVYPDILVGARAAVINRFTGRPVDVGTVSFPEFLARRQLRLCL